MNSLQANNFNSKETVLHLLEQWVVNGWLRAIDLAFARFVAESASDKTAPPVAVFLAALTSYQSGRGHVCLALDQLLADPDSALGFVMEQHSHRARDVVSPAVVMQALSLTGVQTALAQTDFVVSGTGNTPLVLEGSCLYLRRYWQYEQVIRARLQDFLQQTIDLNEKKLQQILDQLFSDSRTQTPNWQKIACALSARSGFSIITGGPGTGKTTTVVKLLAVLQAQALEKDKTRPLLIRMAAPTGKAAARLNASISLQISALSARLGEEGEGICAAISANVCTLHKLLGSRPGTRHFVHHAGNPLSADVVVVDEASMIDVEMMTNLLLALKPSARLILLGDKDQLASVEAGAVLGHLCEHAEAGRYQPSTVAWIQAVTGENIPEPQQSTAGSALDQAVTMLRHSHRFGEQSGIGRLARAVNQGDADAVQQLLCAQLSDVQYLCVQADNFAALDQLLVDGYRSYLQHVFYGAVSGADNASAETVDAWAKAALEKQSAFQLLCAVRKGQWGVEGINQRAEKVLREKNLLQNGGEWYVGRPVIVTRNDYSLGLMNGDMGIALPDAAGHLRVVFADSEKPCGVRWVLPARLVDVETVFAMTVHKSQGSEFAHAALVLPDSANPVLTRELLYTGITRAAQRFTLVNSSVAVLQDCVAQRVRREGGALTV